MALADTRPGISTTSIGRTCPFRARRCSQPQGFTVTQRQPDTLQTCVNTAQHPCTRSLLSGRSRVRIIHDQTPVCDPTQDRVTLRHVSARLDPSWKVVSSPSTPSVDRCVDIFVRPEGTWGFEEFRRDPEDSGLWTPVAYFSHREYSTREAATDAAREAVPWLPEILDARR